MFACGVHTSVRVHIVCEAVYVCVCSINGDVSRTWLTVLCVACRSSYRGGSSFTGGSYTMGADSYSPSYGRSLDMDSSLVRSISLSLSLCICVFVWCTFVITRV